MNSTSDELNELQQRICKHKYSIYSYIPTNIEDCITELYRLSILCILIEKTNYRKSFHLKNFRFDYYLTITISDIQQAIINIDQIMLDSESIICSPDPKKDKINKEILTALSATATLDINYNTDILKYNDLLKVPFYEKLKKSFPDCHYKINDFNTAREIILCHERLKAIQSLNSTIHKIICDYFGSLHDCHEFIKTIFPDICMDITMEEIINERIRIETIKKLWNNSKFDSSIFDFITTENAQGEINRLELLEMTEKLTSHPNFNYEITDIRLFNTTAKIQQWIEHQQLKELEIEFKINSWFIKTGKNIGDFISYRNLTDEIFRCNWTETYYNLLIKIIDNGICTDVNIEENTCDDEFNFSKPEPKQKSIEEQEKLIEMANYELLHFNYNELLDVIYKKALLFGIDENFVPKNE
jgi:hypothetical protein